MRILHLCRQYHPSLGGVERFVSDLASRLAAGGHQVEVATLNRLWQRHERLSAYEVVNGIPVHRLPFAGNALYFVAPGIAGLCSQFDLLHVHNTDFFLDYVAATRHVHRRPFVVSTHGGFFHTADFAALKRLYFGWVTRRSLHAAAVVIPNSRSDERRFGPYARCAVRIDNAIDYAAFAAPGAARQPVPGRIITVGRLAPNKNLGRLLQVFAQALRVQPGLSLAVVGEGPQRAALTAQADALGVSHAVRWTGTIDDADLRRELSQAQVFASAAAYEGFGLAALEAMAAGAVPVVNDIEAFRDVIEDRQTGYLVNYQDVDPAARTVLEVLNLPADRLQAVRQNARAAALGYDWMLQLPKFEEVYKQASRQ
jgi:alpha-1,3-mannosyltransferase